MEVLFILVQPARAENIGAAARAIKTMGFGSMRLVNPAPYDTEHAARVAHGSTSILESMQVYDSIDAAVVDCDLVVATTARRRGMRQEYLSSRSLREFLSDRKSIVSRCAVLFGGEESGLSNDDLLRAQIVTSIPLRSRYPSLNLAQAVMIFAYELSPLVLSVEDVRHTGLNPDSTRVLQEKTRTLLEALDYKPGRALYNRVVERVTQVRSIDGKLLHSLITRILQKLNGS